MILSVTYSIYVHKIEFRFTLKADYFSAIG